MIGMREYYVEITIHETGIVRVEANSAKEAIKKVREGATWDYFDQTENPTIGVRGARLARRTEGKP